MKVLLIGYRGRMGQKMLDTLKEKHEVVLMDKDNRDKATKEDFDVIMDFSLSLCLKENICLALSKNKPIVIATTNHSEENLKLIEDASKKIAVFMSANFSILFNMMLSLADNLKPINGVEYLLSEIHHKDKKDIPSGSLLSLESRLLKNQVSAEVNCIRIADVVGEHEIKIYSKNECLTISHSARDRQVFCDGALMALEFILKKKCGLYTMKDLI